MTLYQDLILGHARAPKYTGTLPLPAVRREEVNRLCGDEVDVWLGWSLEQKASLRANAKGCAICRASASVLMTVGQDLGREQLQGLIANFRAAFSSVGENTQIHHPGDLELLAALLDLKKFAARERCVLLAWDALSALL